jgi:hypothetical protein
MAGERNLDIRVRVNAETGQLEILGAKLKEVGEAAKGTGGSFSGLTGEAKNLLGALGLVASAGGIVKFFSDSVRGAEEENEAIRRLSFGLQSNKISWKDNEAAVLAWGAAIQQTTRFSDTEAFEALDKMVRVTGNLTQAQRASQLAMGLSVASGQQLANTTQVVTDLINGNQRALIEVRREFGSFVGDATTTQEALDRLNAKLGNAANTEDSFTKSTAELKNQFSDFQEQIGRALIPSLTSVVGWLKEGLTWIEKMGTGLAGLSAIILEFGTGWVNALKAIATGNFGQIKDIFRETTQAIQETLLDSAAQFEQVETQKTATAVQHSDVRLQSIIRKKEEENDKYVELEQELNIKIAQIGTQTLAKKQAQLRAEVALQAAKIKDEIKNETERAKLLDKLKLYEHERGIELAKADIKVKRATALEAVSTALEALAIVNEMGESNSRAEARRAKMILALQQAIAIAKILAENAAKPWLAAAETALVIAQFAQQSKAIDDARRASEAGREEFKITTPLPGTDSNLDQIFSNAVGPTNATPLGGTGGTGVLAAGGGGGGGGAGAGTLSVQIGQITVTVNAASVDISNIDTVAQRLAEAAQKGTTRAIQLALALQNAATQNSGLAV